MSTVRPWRHRHAALSWCCSITLFSGSTRPALARLGHYKVSSGSRSRKGSFNSRKSSFNSKKEKPSEKKDDTEEKDKSEEKDESEEKDKSEKKADSISMEQSNLTSGVGKVTANEKLKYFRRKRQNDPMQLIDDPIVDTADLEPAPRAFSGSDDTADLDPHNKIKPVTFAVNLGTKRQSLWGSYHIALEEHPDKRDAADADVVFVQYSNAQAAAGGTQFFMRRVDTYDGGEQFQYQDETQEYDTDTGAFTQKEQMEIRSQAEFFRSLSDETLFPPRSPERPYVVQMNGEYNVGPSLRNFIQKRAVGLRAKEGSSELGGDFLFINFERLMHDQEQNTTRHALPGVTFPYGNCARAKELEPLKMVSKTSASGGGGTISFIKRDDLDEEAAKKTEKVNKLQPSAFGQEDDSNGKTFFLTGRWHSNKNPRAPTRLNMDKTFAAFYAAQNIKSEADFFGLHRTPTTFSLAQFVNKRSFATSPSSFVHNSTIVSQNLQEVGISASTATGTRQSRQQELLWSSSCISPPLRIVCDRLETKTDAPEVLRDLFDRVPYENLMQDTVYSAFTRGHCRDSERLGAILAAGSVPVIFANRITLPYAQLIDWERLVVRVDESALDGTARGAEAVISKIRASWQRDGGEWPPRDRLVRVSPASSSSEEKKDHHQENKSSKSSEEKKNPEDDGVAELRAEYVLPPAMLRKRAEIKRVYNKYFLDEGEKCITKKIDSMLRALRRTIDNVIASPPEISRMIPEIEAEASKDATNNKWFYFL
ncbi:unnamed protein product [Amoebophrya sp. A25]|nr:unnamed protein product [Amoebophrya sp. A25]|eukprot:GSA25T00013106001.1